MSVLADKSLAHLVLDRPVLDQLRERQPLFMLHSTAIEEDTRATIGHNSSASA
jgi:hypothetical protein